MDQNQTQNVNPTNSIWINNPNLKMLLLILIFVLLVSGVGLVIFTQWNTAYREKIYEQTQASVPKHQDRAIATTTPIELTK